MLGLALAAAQGCVSCNQSSALPGASLGSYSVVGTLAANTCGSGLDAQNPWKLTAEMSKDGSTLYLDQSDDSDDSKLASGNVDSSDGATATLTSVITTNVDK